MATNTMTAPLGVFKVQGIAVGKIKGINVRETINRGNVMGVGALISSEVPALSYECTVTFDSYLIDFSSTIFDNKDLSAALGRRVQSTQEFVDTILLNEEGFQVDLMRKVKQTTNQLGIVQSGLEVFATINKIFPTGEGFTLNENQIGGRNLECKYLEPILFPA